MPLSPSVLEGPSPVSYVMKRDGRQEQFDVQKIETSIQHALQAIGNKDRDLPQSLASSVVVYLNRHQVHSKPQSDRVRGAVERVLRAMGQERAAAAYVHHRPHRNNGTETEPGEISVESILPDGYTDSAESVYEVLAGPGNPETNTWRLAEKVKASLALNHLYSRDIADGHREGLLTVRNISRFDSLSSVSLYPERLKVIGVETGAPEWRSSGSARKIDEVLSQLASQTEILFRYVSDTVQWEAVNLTLAPYVLEYDEATLRDVARVLLMEFAYRRSEYPEQYGQITLGLVWNVPAGLTAAEAIGPGGINTGQGYGYYEDTARRFALAILAVYREVTEQELMVNIPELLVTLPHDASAPWEAVCSVESGGISLRLEEQGLWLPFAPDALSVQSCTAQCISFNLHRVGLEATCEDDALAKLDRLMKIIALAHRQRADYLKMVFGKGEVGAMGLLGKPYRSSSLVNPEQVIYWIETDGLFEGVKALLKDEVTDPDQTLDVASRWLIRLQEGCAYWSEALGLSIQLVPIKDEAEPEAAHAKITDIYGSHGCVHLAWESKAIAQRVSTVRDVLTHMSEGQVRLTGMEV